LFNAALAEFELHFFYCNILKKHILNGMPQFSWQPKAKNPPTEFAAGWMLFLVCAIVWNECAAKNVGDG
jgi:hypothetical protein